MNAHWRGLYDILVRPEIARTRDVGTRGLVEANYLATGGRGGITISQWRAIEALPGVEVAAPIATVGFIQAQGGLPGVAFPLSPGTNLYRITAGFQVSDGLRYLRVAKESGLVLGRGATATSPPALLSTFSDAAADDRIGGSAYVTISQFPLTPGLVVAIDPESEEALLRRPGGFGPLTTMPSTKLLDTSRFPLSAVPSRFVVERALIAAALQATSSGPGASQQPSPKPVIPLLLNETATPTVRVTWSVWVRRTHSLSTRAINAGRTGLLQAVYGLSTPERLISHGVETLPHFGLPVSATNILLTPHGISSQNGGSRGPARFSPLLPDRPTYRVVRGGGVQPGVPSLEVRSLGASPAGSVPDPNYYPSFAGTGLPVLANGPALEENYRRLVPFTGLPAAEAGMSLLDRPYFLAPVGTFALDAVRPAYDPLNYAPLGAYDPANTQLVRRPDGSKLGKAVDVLPTFNPAGFIVDPPAAFTNIPAAGLLKGSRPIDAIRVRLSGLTAFDAQARSRLATVADEIRSMGLLATIVAGSSPRPVDIYVPDYLGRGEDLGWVRQQWTSLGAAAQIISGLGRVQWLLLTLVLLVSTMFALIVQLVTVGTRTVTISLLRTLGWSRRDVVRAILGVASGGAALVAIFGVLGAQALRYAGLARSEVIWFPPALAAVWLIAAAVAGWQAASADPLVGSRQGGVTRGRPRRVATAAGYAVRQVSARPTRTILQSVAVGSGAAILAIAGVLLRQSGRRAGPTALAAFTSAAARLDLTAMALVTAILILLGAVILRREELASRRGERLALLKLGWESSVRTRVARVEHVVLTALALPIAGSFAWVGGLALGLGLAASLIPALFACGLALACGAAVAAAATTSSQLEPA